jgi:DNA-binding MarR family transcriptional regulator
VRGDASAGRQNLDCFVLPLIRLPAPSPRLRGEDRWPHCRHPAESLIIPAGCDEERLALFYHSVLDETEPKRISEMVRPMAVHLRPSQALRLWQQVALAEVRDELPDLSMRQMAILFIVYLDPPPHTVRGLAEKLNVTKPVITRALDTMGSLRFVTRHRDERDRRNVLVKRTVEGALFVERFGDVIIAKAGELPL